MVNSGIKNAVVAGNSSFINSEGLARFTYGYL